MYAPWRLQALITSDAETDISSAALAVSVGSMDDPKETQEALRHHAPPQSSTVAYH